MRPDRRFAKGSTIRELALTPTESGHRVDEKFVNRTGNHVDRTGRLMIISFQVAHVLSGTTVVVFLSLKIVWKEE